MAEKKPVRELLEDARSFDCSTLEQAARLGESMKLTEIASYIERAFRIYGMIDADAIAELPGHVSERVAGSLLTAFDLCDKCISFDLKDSNAHAVRNSIRSDAEKLFQDAWGDSHALLAFSARFEQLKLAGKLGAILQDHSASVAQHLAEIDAKAEETSKRNESVLQQASVALNAARDAAAAAGVQFQSNRFHEAAAEHRSTARGWFFVLMVLCVILALWALGGAWVLKWIEQQTGIQIDPTQLIASKVLVFGVLSFAAIIVSRSYFAHCHNAVVNAHRQNALQTYKAIVEATGDEPSRNMVLQQAAACIFAPQSSGYARESSGRPPSVNIIETIGSHLGGKQEF